MNKSLIVEQIIKHLNQKIADTIEAAEAAHLAAIDDQSVAETQYDTLAIESAYLAEGQTRRIEQYKAELELMKHPSLCQEGVQKVGLGSLVRLEKESGEYQYVYIAPAGAGLEIKAGSNTVNVITPNAPIGASMMGFTEGEEFELIINQKAQQYYLAKVY